MSWTAKAAYTAHQAQKAWTENSTHKWVLHQAVVPQMVDGNNEAHIEMIERFLEKPINPLLIMVPQTTLP